MNDHSNGQPDSDILQMLRLRKIEAVDRLVERFGRPLTRAAFLFLNDAEAADDAVQETFIAAWDSAGRIRQDADFRSWLFGVLFNTCRKHCRSVKRRLKREKSYVDLAGLAGGKPQDRQRIEAIGRCMQMLEEDHRIVIILRYEQGCDVSQAAEILGLPEGTIKSRTHAAIRKMKELMGQFLERD
ncbi:MAG: sigma-70 family RNA polymerase sigma factor [Planctomycetes bacterium]|nr:sigma-70 family RNA polymerase sigma factor [Planctomycetota bacterium]